MLSKLFLAGCNRGRAEGLRDESMDIGQTTYAVFIGHLLAIEDAPHTFVARATTSQIVAARTGHLRITGHAGRTAERCTSAILGPGRRYGIEWHGPQLLRLFIDAKSEEGKLLETRFRAHLSAGSRAISGFPPAMDTAVWRAIEGHEYAAAVVSVFRSLGVSRPVSKPHPAVAKAVAELDRFDHDIPTPTDLLKVAGIPAGQMYSFFARYTGVTIGTYARWQRLRRFCVALTQSSDWSDAARRAGFRPPSLLKDAIVRTFGLPASALETGWWIAP
jgi:AraC-like DNA-binding protein